MRKYLYFLSADARHLQTRLERLQARGLELVDTQGLLTGRFERTGRTDVQYLVVPCGSAKNFPRGDLSSYGWELSGGFNGMAIFKSLPCVEPDREALLDKLRQDGRVRSDRWTLPLTLILLLAAAAGISWGRQQLGLGAWYLSYRSIGLLGMQWLLLILAAAHLLSLRTYLSAWVHGLTPIILVGWLFLTILLGQLDETAKTVYFSAILLALAVACAMTLWRRGRALGLGMAGLCLVVLCLGLLFPNVDRSDAGGRSLRDAVSDRSVAQLSDLGDESDLSLAGYTTGGTLLVRTVSYWEISEEASLSSVAYHCLTGSLAGEVQERLLSSGSWTETGYGWTSREGKSVLLRDGTDVAIITWSEALTEVQVETLREEIFS